jgi:hypothetical protein
MVEDCKQVARIICGESGEGLVHGVHFRKTISLFADELSTYSEGYEAAIDNSMTLRHCKVSSWWLHQK